MKKTLIIALVMTMLFGCGKRYRIEYSDCEDMFGSPVQSAPAGSKVKLKLYPVMDASETVYVDGERISSEGQKGKFIIYKFTMPDHDVNVEVRISSSQMVSDDLLYEYYYQVAGTEMKQPYYRITVTKTNDKLVIKETVDGGTKEEKVNTYQASRQLIEEINAVIEKYDMDNWQNLEIYDCLDGVAQSFTYLKNGEYIRVDINKLPEDGQKGLGEIRVTLRRHME